MIVKFAPISDGRIIIIELFIENAKTYTCKFIIVLLIFHEHKWCTYYKNCEIKFRLLAVVDVCCSREPRTNNDIGCFKIRINQVDKKICYSSVCCFCLCAHMFVPTRCLHIIRYYIIQLYRTILSIKTRSPPYFVYISGTAILIGLTVKINIFNSSHIHINLLYFVKIRTYVRIK